ncbi:uncharacterized protein AAES06_005585 [Glossophaga mutica]
MEPEALEICPYDPIHRMPASRLQYHLALWKEDSNLCITGVPSFVLRTFAPKMLVCESDSRDIKKETMDEKHPNNSKSNIKSQNN